jgi:hypothetical protein
MATDKIKAQKLTHYSLPWTEFAPNPDNFRHDVEAHIKEQNLLELIKADGGVRVPVLVAGAKYNIDGKRRIVDGDSRRLSMEFLSVDPEYIKMTNTLDANGIPLASWDIPFFIVPDDVMEDPKKLAKLKLSANWVNSQTTTVEQWSGIQEIINHFRSEYPEEPPVVADPDNLTDQDIQNRKNFLREQNYWVIQQTSKFIGFSETLLYEYLRVFEKGSPRLLELIEEGVIVSVRTGDLLQRYHRRLLEEGSNMTIDQFINECYSRALADGKLTLGRNTVEYTYKALSLPVAQALEKVQIVDAELKTVQNGAKQLELDTRSEADLTRLQGEVNNLTPEDLEDAQTVQNGVTQLPTQKPTQTNSSSGAGATQREPREPREPKQQEEKEEEIYDRSQAIGDINDLIAMAMAVDDDQLWALPEKNIIRIGRTAKQLITEFTALQEILGKERQKAMQQEEIQKLKEQVKNIENGNGSSNSEEDSEEDVEFDDDLEQSKTALELLSNLREGLVFNTESDGTEEDVEFDDDVE